MSPIQIGVFSKYGIYYMCTDVPGEEKPEFLYDGKEMTVWVLLGDVWLLEMERITPVGIKIFLSGPGSGMVH